MKHIPDNSSKLGTFFKLAILEVWKRACVIYNNKRNKPQELIFPVIASTDISHPLIIKIFGTYALFGFLAFLIVKNITIPASTIPNSFLNHYPDIRFPIGFPINKYNKKRILPLFLHCPFEIGQYVIFRQKNKNNPSLVHIKLGEIGIIVEKLSGLDQALVDFSIDVPVRFKKLDTANIVKNAFLEKLLIIEII